MILLLTLLACAPPPTCEASGKGLGTTWAAHWRAPACDDLDATLGAIVDDIEAKASVWTADSELHAIRDGVGAVEVSEETAALVADGLLLAAITEGAFEPTLEPLMVVWGFRGDADPAEPDPAALADARARVGWERVRIGRTDGVPWVDASDAALDLSAILEGYTADRLSAALSSRGLADHLIDVAGEFRAAGTGPDGAWVVPAHDGTVRVANAGFAMSSPDGRAIELDGAKISSTLDPRVGRPLPVEVTHVGVVAPTAAMADGLATSVAVLGPEAGLALLERLPDVEGYVEAGGATKRTSGLHAEP